MRRSILLFLRRGRYWVSTLFRSIKTTEVNFIIEPDEVALKHEPTDLNYLNEPRSVPWK